MYYSYKTLISDVVSTNDRNGWTAAYVTPYLIGRSYYGRDIVAFLVGRGTPKYIIQGAIHGREHITAKLVSNLMKKYDGNEPIAFIPLSNPDGVMLSENGLLSINPELISKQREIMKQYLILSDAYPKNEADKPVPTTFDGTGFNDYDEDELKIWLQGVNYNNNNFINWKANGRAVDINVNFDANWGKGANNITYPAPEDYIGPYPFSEPETKALRDYTLLVQPLATISYHAKGNVIYWGFEDNYNYEKQANVISTATGYPLLTSTDSAGGYKDWYDLVSDRLGLTIEIGNNNLTYEQLYNTYPMIFKANSEVPHLLDKMTSEFSLPPQ